MEAIVKTPNIILPLSDHEQCWVVSFGDLEILTSEEKNTKDYEVYYVNLKDAHMKYLPSMVGFLKKELIDVDEESFSFITKFNIDLKVFQLSNSMFIF